MRSIPIELAVAAAVIGSVAFLGEGPPSHQGRSSPQLEWSSRALPEITVLVGDLTTLQSDSAAGAEGLAAGTALTVDSARLQHDIAAARALPAPPSEGLRPEWSSAILRLDSVVSASGRLEALQKESVADREWAANELEAAVGQAVQSLLRLAASTR
ncbi:MAG TPA: hypothetical protein VFH56_02355 [Acidimicrobiales bacterium]|nr:hypothetical protein [Acidimicrobiales bacterium]